eukprot:m.975489 g.975489  ORF g.975489 m.975489 type:complete len:662 (+) comp23941_c0_seq2:3854-5839(+)
MLCCSLHLYVLCTLAVLAGQGVGVVTEPHLPGGGACRCVPPNPCWNRVPWDELNASTHGRLMVIHDEMQRCIENINSDACAVDLNNSKNEFWLSGQVAGYMHTGLFGVWNISNMLGAYAVAAQTESDVQAAVAFAQKHNLRLVIKSTGHDWFGRSTAPGSLVVWMHLRKNMIWHDSFTPTGCGEQYPHGLHAVTMEAGVQFADLYPAAERVGRLVVGGTCDTVGVVGCGLGGCFGPFSKLFGSAASNMVEARVVLPNGTVVVANKCSHPDLFWSLRGGGAGVAGVVTSLTERTYPRPRWYAGVKWSCTVVDAGLYHGLVVEALRAAEAGAAGHWGGGMGVTTHDDNKTGASAGKRYTTWLSFLQYEGSASAGQALIEPLLKYVAEQLPAGSAECSHSTSNWTQQDYTPGMAPPWEEVHADREISTSHLVSLTKYITTQTLSGPNDTGRKRVASALMNITHLLPKELVNCTYGIIFDKAQAGLTPYAQLLFNETAQNPILQDTVAMLEVAERVPFLPQLPFTASVLRSQWPRLQEYAITTPTDPLYAVCSAGASSTGTDAQARECFGGWLDRVPRLRDQLRNVKRVMWDVFPNLDVDGSIFSGSYWNEADYFDPEFQRSFWGEDNYVRLLNIKDTYDPDGLFTCHHCVGSERWTPDGNCRIK